MEAIADFKSNNAALFSSRFSTLPSSIKVKGGHGGQHAHHVQDTTTTAVVASSSTTGMSVTGSNGGKVRSAATSVLNSNQRLQGSFIPTPNNGDEAVSFSSSSASRQRDVEVEEKRPSTASGVFATIRSTLQSSPKLGKGKKYQASTSASEPTAAILVDDDGELVMPTRHTSRSFDAIADRDGLLTPSNSQATGIAASNNCDDGQHPRKSSWPSITRNHSGGTATLISTSHSTGSNAAVASSSAPTSLPAADEHLNAPVVGFMSLFNRAKAKQQQLSATATSSWSTTSRAAAESPQSISSESPPLSPKGINDRTSDVVQDGTPAEAEHKATRPTIDHHNAKIVSPRTSPLSTAMLQQQQAHRNSPLVIPTSTSEASLPSFHDKLSQEDGGKFIKPVVSHNTSLKNDGSTMEDNYNDKEAVGAIAVAAEPKASNSHDHGHHHHNHSNTRHGSRGSRPPPPTAKGVRFADPISMSESYAMHTLKTTTNNILKLAKGIDPFQYGDNSMPRSILHVKISPQYLALLQSNQISNKKSGVNVHGSQAGNPMVNQLGNLVYPAGSSSGGFAAGITVLPTNAPSNQTQDLFSMVSPISSTINTINTMNNTLANKHIPPNTNAMNTGQASQQGGYSASSSPTATSVMVRDSMVVQKTLAEIHRRYGIQGQQQQQQLQQQQGLSMSSSLSILPSVQQQSGGMGNGSSSYFQQGPPSSASGNRSGTPIPAQVRKNMRQQGQSSNASGRPSTAPAGSGGSSSLSVSVGSGGGSSLDDFVNAAVFTLFTKSIQVNQVIVRSHSSNHNGGVNFFATHLSFSFPANDYNRTLVMQYKDISAVNLTGNKLRLKGGISNDSPTSNTTNSTVVMEFGGGNGSAANTSNNAALVTIRERIIPMIMSQSFSR